MSFQSQRSIPSSNQRGGLAGLGLSTKAGGFFENDRTLPMYKDKPYFQPRRTAPRRGWKTILTVLAVSTFGLFWFFYNSDSSATVKIPESKDKGADLWKWMRTFEDKTPIKNPDWNARREKVRDAFIVSFDGYEKNAWGMWIYQHVSWSLQLIIRLGFDEYSPVSNRHRNMVEGGLGWMIVDSLDTMILMNLTSQVRHARQWISTSLKYDQDHDVSTFETTIRMLGGLLSAHYLSTQYPDLAPLTDDDTGAAGEDLYIEKATDLGDRLMSAFDTPTGIPYSSVNLNQSKGLRSHADAGAASTAEATSVQLEFKYLAKLTGEAEYWKTAEKPMEAVDKEHPQDGLVPIFIHPDTGKFRGENIRLGSRGDSYYGLF